MSKRFWLLVSIALGLGLVVGLMTAANVASDPIPGKKVQIPRIDVGDIYGTGDWQTKIQVQNVGETDTGAVMFLWGEYSELCPTNDPGPIAHYCMNIVYNALWTLDSIDPRAKSAIVYSVSSDSFWEACQRADHLADPRYNSKATVNWAEWKEDWETPGGYITKSISSLAVVVNRWGPNEYTTTVSSAYTGISEDMEGDMYPYEYFAPYVMKGYNNLDTVLTIQNSGQNCTSIWIDYMEQGWCEILYEQHITELAPGEAYRTQVPCEYGEIQCPFLGSARIRAHEPLGIIIDQTSLITPCGSLDRGILKTARARALRESRHLDGETTVITDTLFYADLLFREWSGWSSSIQVQNLSLERQQTFVTVDFMDASGNEITYVGDWICDIGSWTAYLPAILDLGRDYVGAAEIQSHRQIAHPSEPAPAQPIYVIVDMNKNIVFDTDVDRCAAAGLPAPCWRPTVPGETQGAAYNAHPYSQKVWQKSEDERWEDVVDIALPFLSYRGQDLWTSLIAVRNNSNCNKIKVIIELKDETGVVVCWVGPFWLRPKAIKLIDLGQLGCIAYGWLGAGRVKVQDMEVLCAEAAEGEPPPDAAMPSVVVVERGTGEGDVTKVYEGIPVGYPPKYGDVKGTVTDCYDDAPIEDALIEIASPIRTGTTDTDGNYLVSMVSEGSHAITASKTDYIPAIDTVKVPGLGEATKDFCLICSGNAITGTLYYTDTAKTSLQTLDGATVNITYTVPYTTTDPGVQSDTTSGGGKFSVNSLPRGLTLTITISEANYETLTATHMFTECPKTIDISPTITNSILCKYGTISGNVKIGGVNAEGETIKAWYNSTVYSDTTNAAGNYLLSVPTGLGSPPGPAPGWTYTIKWVRTGDTESKQFNACGESITNVDFSG